MIPGVSGRACGVVSSVSAAGDFSGNGLDAGRIPSRSVSANRSPIPTTSTRSGKPFRCLGVESMEARKDRILVPQRQAMRKLKKQPFPLQRSPTPAGRRRPDGRQDAAGRTHPAAADSASLIGADEKMVGILLPPSVRRRAGEPGRLVPAARGGQLELHALEPGRQSLHPRSGHQARAHEPAVPREAALRPRLPKWCCSKTCCKEVTRLDEADRRRSRRIAVPAFILERMLGMTTHQARRLDDGHFHFRIDGRAQRRDADAREHRHQSSTRPTSCCVSAATTC